MVGVWYRCARDFLFVLRTILNYRLPLTFLMGQNHPHNAKLFCAVNTVCLFIFVNYMKVVPLLHLCVKQSCYFCKSRARNVLQTGVRLGIYVALTGRLSHVYGSVHKGGAQNVTFYYTSVVVLKLWLTQLCHFIWLYFVPSGSFWRTQTHCSVMHFKNIYKNMLWM